jgi:uncharacterized cupin superfamily protein
MPTIINPSELEFVKGKSDLDKFNWHTCVPRLAELVNSKHLIFDVRSLDAGKYSYPYHFHKFSEELFVIFSGSAILRSPNGLQTIKQGDIIFFEIGESGTHQLYNHGDVPCVYLDIRTNVGFDITEYPDSGKINIAPNQGIFEKKAKVDYFKGEENIDKIWDDLKTK